MEVLDVLIQIGTPIATGIAGWWAGRPKTKVEIEATSVDNAGKVIDKWEGYADRLEKNIETLKSVIDELNEALKMANDEKVACGKALMKLQEEYNDLMRLYNEMQTEFERGKE